eukprot:CAMPEP_0119029474 /NCGR_PEP_ID=MMETSP1176-20130426/40539_1 /TAXON_ID=265551 /ORGANISM="Synedropsis recta cf, Strain CCMP1620" /LENGTH=212 /DNA_ID=CAMNT_0006985819 /DNA_START=41 /DNA_END=679 /DNA_ORIENTATION=+
MSNTDTTTSTDNASPVSKELDSSNNNIRQLTFGVPLPNDVAHDPLSDLPAPVRSLMGDAGIVGSVLLLKNSAMIWLGWGNIDTRTTTTTTTTSTDGDDSTAVEGRGVPNMGQMTVAFPRTKYQGAFSGAGESSCSALVGGDSEDQVLGWQMASRLSQKLGYPIFVSCALFASDPPEWMAGLDKAMATQRAAALAERKVRQILKDEGVTAMAK